jgi:hypothetical protein
MPPRPLKNLDILSKIYNKPSASKKIDKRLNKQIELKLYQKT